MKILQICNKVPYPAKDGGAIATLNLTTSFNELGHEVSVLAMSTPKHNIHLNDIDKSLKQNINWNIVQVYNEIKPLKALWYLLRNKSYNVARFEQAEFNNQLKQLLKEQTFDIIQLEGLYLFPYVQTIRKYSNAKVSYRAHNIEYEIWERMSQQETNFIKRIYLSILAKQLKSYEEKSLKEADLIIPITERDNQAIQQHHPSAKTCVIPVGVDIQIPSPDENTNDPFFIGSLDWLPNQEGIKWLIEQVWNKLPKDITLKVAGRNTPKSIFQYGNDNIKILGEVENAISFMQDNGLMLAPLFSGSGMRVKIIEGMALGKCIITTSIGAEGIPISNGENIIIADDPDSFKEAIFTYHKDAKAQAKIGKAAKQLVQEKFSKQALAKHLLEFYEKHI